LRVDTVFLTDFLERPTPEIGKEILAPAILRVLKTLRHHLRVLQMPEVDVFGIIAAEKKIQSPVAIVVKPDCGVGIDPRRQSGLLSHARKLLARIVVKEFRLAPLVNEKIFITVVVVVSPDRSPLDTPANLVPNRTPHVPS